MTKLHLEAIKEQYNDYKKVSVMMGQRSTPLFLVMDLVAIVISQEERIIALEKKSEN